MVNFNPNTLNQNGKGWIEEVSDNWQKYSSIWLLDYKNGALEEQDIINVIGKIIKYKVNKI